MDLFLKGKSAVVTGGARGIGAAICRTLAAEGVHVAVVDVDEAAASSVAAECNMAGAQAVAIGCDVTDEQSVSDMVTRVASDFGGIDILVNNAGFTRDMRIGEMSMHDWDLVVDVVLKGAFLCTKAVLPHMESRGGGRIVNMSSRAHLGNAGQANYSAAKAGLIGFTRAMSKEHGRHLITVNAIAPGIVDTEAVRSLPHYGKISEAASRSTPIPRLGTVNDIAGAVAFLVSGLASFISGEVLHVTGGRY